MEESENKGGKPKEIGYVRMADLPKRKHSKSILVLLLNTFVFIVEPIKRAGAGISDHPVNCLVLVKIGAADVFAVEFVVVVIYAGLAVRQRSLMLLFYVAHNNSLPSSTAETSLSP